MSMQSSNTTGYATETAYSIGRKLCKEAIWVGDLCAWPGSTIAKFNGKEQLAMRTFGPDLHSGLSGIALFLAELVVLTGDTVIRNTQEAAVKNILRQIEANELPDSFGFYKGGLGIGYALWKLGRILDREEWIKAGLESLDPLHKVSLAEQALDVVTGLAGTIPALLKLYDKENNPEFLELAVRCGEHLINEAQKEDEYWSWLTLPEEIALTGYAHGSGGIALSLLELNRCTGESKFLDASNMGFAYENAHFDARKNNWPDLRYAIRNHLGTSDDAAYADSWRHGASGIALCRLRAYQITGNVDRLQEARIALDTTCDLVSAHLKNPSGANYSLSDGLAGNADILMTGSRVLNDPVYAQVAQQVARLGIMLYDHTDSDWPSGVLDPAAVSTTKNPTPGLMLGLAGTGYFYLRLAQGQIPDSLLILNDPGKN